MIRKMIEMDLYKGRPNTVDGRLEKEIKVYDFLDRLNISYDRVDHGEVMTMDACKEIDQILNIKTCKNLFLCDRKKKAFYLLLMPSDKAFCSKDVSSQIGSSRLSFADEVYLNQYLHIQPGAVSIMGLINDVENHVQLLVDHLICQSEYIGCHPCVNTASLKIKTEDIIQKLLPEVQHQAIVVNL